jgi:D-arabinose 1-dehydrogenase-like Zn-dependent alcohol dehydrogenase
MAIPFTMKAVVLHAADDMRVQAWPVPELGPGEVLLKVEVASICGTDVKVLHRKLLGQPDGQFIMGHEYAGTVAALGPGSSGTGSCRTAPGSGDGRSPPATSSITSSTRCGSLTRPSI